MSLNPRFHQFPVIREYMTPAPHTVGVGQPLATAQRIMRDHHIRHLPVLEGGEVRGVLSERDVYLVESLPGANPAAESVEDAMVEDVLTASPDAPVAEVVDAMVRRKVGSAVVVEGAHAIGVFTAIDAMKALLDALSDER